MTKPDLKPIHGMPGFMQEYYRRYLPSAYDPSMSIYEQMIQVIEHLNQMNVIVGSIAEQWNILCQWIMNDGLNEAVRKQLEKWLEDGTLEKIINEEIFPQLDTLVKDTINVKTPPKPLVALKGDGSDETEAIRNLLNACSDRNVYFPFGTYAVNDEIEITANNINIQFSQGAKVTVVNDSVLKDKGLKASVFALTGNNITIDGVYMHGNVVNNYVQIGDIKYYTAFPSMPTGKYVGYTAIRVGGNYNVVKNARIEWFSWNAILVDTKRDDTIKTNVIIDNVWTDKISEDSISIHRYNDVTVKNCTIVDPLHHGVHVYFMTNNVKVLNNDFRLQRSRTFEFYPDQKATEAWGGIGVDHASYPESDCKKTLVQGNTINGEFQFGVEIMGFAEDVEVYNNIMNCPIGDGVRLSSPVQGFGAIGNNIFTGCKAGLTFFWNSVVNGVGTRTYRPATLKIHDNNFHGSLDTHLRIGEAQGTAPNPMDKFYIEIKDNNFKKGTSALAYSLHMDTDRDWITYNINGNDFTNGAISVYSNPTGKGFDYVMQFCNGNYGQIDNGIRTQATNPSGRISVPKDATEIDVVLTQSLKQKDIQYDVLPTTRFDHGGIWATGITETGFKIRWKNPQPFDTITIGWMIVR